MADTTKIEWTDATWNPITGCTLVDQGCKNCYAAELAATRLKHHPSREGLARKNADGVAAFTGEVRFNEQWLDQPLRWTKPRMIFVCAHGDLFHNMVPDEWIDKVFAVMALCPQHTFQVLTKRPMRAAEYLLKMDEKGRPTYWDTAGVMAATGRWNTGPISAKNWPLPNVWLGTSVSDQDSADERIPHLLNAPAAVRFVSAEPLLGPVDFLNLRWRESVGNPTITICANVLEGCDACGETIGKLEWIIVGGESGRNARPMHPDWVRPIRDQCKAAGTAFFFKQWGTWAPVDDDCWSFPDGSDDVAMRESAHNWQDGNQAVRIGKKAAGRTLDGKTWDEMPEGVSPSHGSTSDPLPGVTPQSGGDGHA